MIEAYNIEWYMAFSSGWICEILEGITLRRKGRTEL